MMVAKSETLVHGSKDERPYNIAAAKSSVVRVKLTSDQ